MAVILVNRLELSIFLRNGLCLVPSSRNILTSLKMQCRFSDLFWALWIRLQRARPFFITATIGSKFLNSIKLHKNDLLKYEFQRFQDQFKQRRPTELTQAHSSFRPIYESLFTETDFRPSYVAVIGFDEPRWSLSHEKRLVHVLLELIASGIVSEDKLDLAELVSLPSIPFLEFEPLKKAPKAKRLRFSSGSPNDSYHIR